MCTLLLLELWGLFTVHFMAVQTRLCLRCCLRLGVLITFQSS
uniref:Uncharacterized protein n=1 Tax=Brassica campestris TaxID=3711 RepID=A0A3P5YPE1_BRACM|nr:unnamed protein product [Brassica rapa]